MAKFAGGVLAVNTFDRTRYVPIVKAFDIWFVKLTIDDGTVVARAHGVYQLARSRGRWPERARESVSSAGGGVRQRRD